MMLRKESWIHFLAGVSVGFVTWAGTVGAQAPGGKKPSMDQNVVAEVNGVLITRQQLAEELIARKGKSQLDALVNRTMIEQACKAQGIVVSDQEIQSELLSQMTATSSASLADFEKSVLRPQKTTLLEFREDVIRPKMMIQKLAKARLAISDDDLKREFETRYGEKVACRMITFKDPRQAQRAFAEIKGDPNAFIRLAKMQENLDLAASAGMLAPIGRHMTHDVVEKRAFGMKEGEVSEVIQTPEGGYVILLKEHHFPARTEFTFEQKKEELRAAAVERKSQKEVPLLIKSLKQEFEGKIKIYLDKETDLKNLLEKYKGLEENSK